MDTLFACPKCKGWHFNITRSGLLICTSVMTEGEMGCGWKGVLNEPAFQSDDTVIPSESSHGPKDRSDMYYTEGYQNWLDNRNRGMK